MKKLKIKNILILVLIVAIGIMLLIKQINYINSYEYKLKDIGYSETEITTLLKELDNKKIDQILSMKYNKNITNLITEDYFIFNNLNKYLNYYENNANVSTREIIEKVNVNRDKDYYTDVLVTDTTKDNLILVNKYFKLDENYTPKNIININLQYSYSGNRAIKEVNDHFVEMRDAVKSEKGYNIVVSSSYREYKDQKELYDRRKKDQGEEAADKLAARPGHSEHQLGLALDLDLYGKTYDKFEDTEEYTWLVNNCYKYGFILRYPKDKENITGYSFESWHYRYVGLEVAKYIHDNKITFDEYYEYFINKGLH